MDIKTAVVTGAGSGIGQKTAIRLAKRGYKVIAIGRKIESLKETSRLSGEHAAMVIPKVMDVADKKSVLNGFDDIDSVEVFVASAGICHQGRLDQEDADQVWESVMATNVDGVWYMFRALNSKFSPDARVVVVSSGLGKLGRPGYGAYTASKHAVLGLVKSFAKELAPNKITVNAVCPGWVNTSMAQGDLVHTSKQNGTTPQEEFENAISSIPLKRFVEADEVASLIDWLTSKDAGAVTGQAYNISCGEFYA
jgi:NAD(P)-dependent dehydrogenase (short-subunit alcohol dehydrogenase family)